MAEVVVMPQLGNSVETCLVTSWEVEVGDWVAENQVICQVETDKAEMEVPSTTSGVVLRLLCSEGDEVPVKEPIMVIGQVGETVSSEQLNLNEAGPGEPKTAEPVQGTTPETKVSAVPLAEETVSMLTRGVSPRARRVAAERGLNPDRIETGTGPAQRVIERDVQAVLAAQPPGTGIGGRRVASDQLSSQQSSDETTSAEVDRTATDFPGPFTEMALKGVRKIIAERMMTSLSSSAQLTYTASADATGLLEFRARLKKSAPELGLNQVTIGDLVGFAVVKTLPSHPSHNAHLSNGMLRTFQQVHLGFACDTPRGLLVPTIRSASDMTLKEFSLASRELAAEAIEGKINPDLLSWATFTISNLGSFGIESFTPLINLPQTAILGVDTISPRAVINPDGSFGVQPRIGLSLTADHQVIDGADAARFLKDLVQAIEAIDLTVLR